MDLSNNEILLILLIFGGIVIKWGGAKLMHAVLFVAIGTFVGGTVLAVINGGINVGEGVIGGLLSHVTK